VGPRGLLRAALLLAALLAAPSPAARAGVEGSPHDVLAQGYDATRVSLLQERCNRCHLSATAGEEILPAVAPSLEARWGEVGAACFSCHDGTTIVSPDVDASMTAYHPDSHGVSLAGYEDLRTEETGLPHLGAGRMDCVTCHDPHDNSHRPFLRADLKSLCLSCHSRLAEVARGKENRTGNHILGIDPARARDKDVPLVVTPPFRVPFPASYPLQRGKGSVGTHWTLGGHLAAGAEGELACVTCHAVHGGAQAPPKPPLLAADPVGDVADRFCEGCHAGQRGDGQRSDALPNPGGTTAARTYHPCDDDLSNGEGRIVEVEIPKEWPVGGGSPARLICTSCHRAHGGRVASQLLRRPVKATAFCEECHVQLTLEYHHSVAAGGKCAPYVPAPPEGEPPGLRCASCHQAHNAGLDSADEKRFVPILRLAEGPDSCVACHPDGNPTCGTLPEYRASHFLGDPGTAYGDAAPPERILPWPESGQTSRYGGADGRSVTCLSCHTFRKGAVVSGDQKNARHLLARSGNPVDWPEGGESIYLCAGCHSVDPGTGLTKGHSHPMMKADVTKLGRLIDPPVTSSQEGHVNCDSCHRPHEAVSNGGYYILEAVDGTNTNPKAVEPLIDFTVICHKCHDAGKY
jgi:predicted CXXCH cytochrome family protein